MIKRTLCFSNSSYLSTANNQLVIHYPGQEKCVTIPIEDIGLIMLECSQITITSNLITKLLEHKVMVIHCNNNLLPDGLIQPLVGHTLYAERIQQQIKMSTPLKKKIWQQVVACKIRNQAAIMAYIGVPNENLLSMVDEVHSGDNTNLEGQAAAYYFRNLFDKQGYNRDDKEMPPNPWLNYGYTILRALTARAISSTGLLPQLGIFHHNKYDAYCLADDLMEPYRPFVDLVVLQMVERYGYSIAITTEQKKDLLQIPQVDTLFDNKRSPLMVALSRTTSSFYDCICGIKRKIIYPSLCYDGITVQNK